MKKACTPLNIAPAQNPITITEQSFWASDSTFGLLGITNLYSDAQRQPSELPPINKTSEGIRSGIYLSVYLVYPRKIDMLHSKNLTSKLFLLALLCSGALGLSAASIVCPIATPAANAQLKILDRLPIPTGAYLSINGRGFFYGSLNDPSLIVPGVAWQINGGENGGVLLKGYGNVPRAIIDLVDKLFFRPVRVE